MTISSTAPVNAQIPLTQVIVDITGDHSGSGNAVSYSSATTMAYLENIGAWALEYKVGSGEWIRLELRNSTRLNIDMSATSITLRKALFTGQSQLRLTFDGAPTGYVVDDGDAVDLGAGGGASAFTQLSDAPNVLRPYSLVLTNIGGSALECLPRALLEDYASLGVQANSSLGVNAYADADYADPSAGAFISATAETTDATSPIATVGASISTAAKSAQIQFRAFVDSGEGIAEMLKGPTDHFQMVNFDIAASDTSATAMLMTADSKPNMVMIKALKVKIGGDFFYIPLFNPD